MRTLLVAAAVVVGLASNASAQPSSGLNRATVVFSATAAADWITTYRTLSARDNCRDHFCPGANADRNPILRPIDSPARVVAVGAALDAGAILLARRIGKGHPRLVKAVLYGAAGYRGFLSVRNEVALQRSQTRAAALNAIYGPYRY